MFKALLCTAAVGLGLSLTGTAEAHGGHHRYGHHRVARAYYRTHAVRFTGGYCYRGYTHHHWTRRVWDARCHRYNYYDPGLHCYFYWYAPANCYYPVTYCP
jgi:hypothetical protein